MSDKRIEMLIKNSREELGLSRKELACKLKVNTRTIGYWELGEREPDIVNLMKLSILFNIPIDDMF